jgi:16S rRNA (uracil1498-N3)-methyltransferase
MSDTRLYTDAPLVPGEPVELQDDRARYVSRVLRLRPDDIVTLFDGRGAEYPARITALRKDRVLLTIDERHEVDRESRLRIHLLQGISRGERMDFAVQKATELGVARVTPVLTEYSVVKLNEKRAQKKTQHWQAVAASACEQCGRNVLPVVEPPITLRNWMGEHHTAKGKRIVLQPGANTAVSDLGEPVDEITVLVGPEGGFSDTEYELAAACHFQAVGFGPRILRTETAAAAILTALQTLYGDLA